MISKARSMLQSTRLVSESGSLAGQKGPSRFTPETGVALCAGVVGVAPYRPKRPASKRERERGLSLGGHRRGKVTKLSTCNSVGSHNLGVFAVLSSAARTSDAQLFVQLLSRFVEPLLSCLRHFTC